MLVSPLWLALERVLITLWIGLMWALGFVVVPTLFAVLESRQAAGEVAARLFGRLSITGMVCGVALLALAVLVNPRRRYRGWPWRCAVILIVLVVTMIGEYLLTPQMAALKQATPGEFMAGSEPAQQFERLHGLASALFVLNCVLGLALVIWPSYCSVAARPGAQSGGRSG